MAPSSSSSFFEMKAPLIFLASFAVSVSALGGWAEVSVAGNAAVASAAAFASRSVSGRLNGDFHAKLARLHGAKQQIVAGTNYDLNLTLGITNCKKDEIEYDRIETCDFQDGLFKKCIVKVFNSLQNEYKLSEFTCGPDSLQKFGQREMFEDFLVRHNKQYEDDEEKERRFGIFRGNLIKIKVLNDHERGTATYGITKFADLSEQEFRDTSLGFRPDLMRSDDPPMAQAEIPTDPLPESVDWRLKGVVSEVKNQGSCGSCWAFSATGNIEGQWALKKKSLLSLSEQELVDCDKLDEGCNGGLPSNAYKEIIRLGGLEGEKDYPYEGEDETCDLEKKEIKVFINSSVAISPNETDMAHWLAKNGPISIGINANGMQFYFGGISHPWKFLCSPSSIDHGVLIVGYGVHTYPIFKKVMPFWIVKNSWGASWGEQGYYRVFRGDGTCGLNTMATSAIVD